MTGFVAERTYPAPADWVWAASKHSFGPTLRDADEFSHSLQASVFYGIGQVVTAQTLDTVNGVILRLTISSKRRGGGRISTHQKLAEEIFGNVSTILQGWNAGQSS